MYCYGERHIGLPVSYTRDTMARRWSLLFAVLQVFSLLASFYAYPSDFNQTRVNLTFDLELYISTVLNTALMWRSGLYMYNPFFRNHNSYLPRYKNNPFLRDLWKQITNDRFSEDNNTNASSPTKLPRNDSKIPQSPGNIEFSFSPNVTTTVVNDSRVTILPTLSRELSFRSKSRDPRPSAQLCAHYASFFERLLPFEEKRIDLFVNEGSCSRDVVPVFGGETVEDGLAHVVALGRWNKDKKFSFHCGGTIISNRWVLTAAHCTHGAAGGVTVVLVGTRRLSDSSANTIRIKRTIRHPSYKPPALYADIALLELDEELQFSANLRPACLPANDKFWLPFASVCGWGATEFDGDESDTLQEAYLIILDNTECEKKHNGSIAVPNGVTSSMICAGSSRRNRLQDTCRGDSGGPLQALHPLWSCLDQVIGITSFGSGCAFVDTPGIYTKVSYYLEWIEDTIWPNNSSN